MILCIIKGMLPLKMHKIIFFQKENNEKQICVPVLPEFFRPVTSNTIIFLALHLFV